MNSNEPNTPPKLSARLDGAMRAIADIMTSHDMMGVVVIADGELSASTSFLQSSWSIVKTDPTKPGEIQFRVLPEDWGNDQDKLKTAVTKTTAAIDTLARACEIHSDVLSDCVESFISRFRLVQDSDGEAAGHHTLAEGARTDMNFDLIEDAKMREKVERFEPIIFDMERYTSEIAMSFAKSMRTAGMPCNELAMTMFSRHAMDACLAAMMGVHHYITKHGFTLEEFSHLPWQINQEYYTAAGGVTLSADIIKKYTPTNLN